MTSDDYWLIYFEDADRRPEIYTDAYAALRRYESCLMNWNCHLFRQVGKQHDQGLVEYVARVLCSQDAHENTISDGRSVVDLVWKVHADDARKAIAAVSSAVSDEIYPVQVENARLRRAFEVLKVAIDGSIHTNDEPNRVILSNGNILEGEAADAIHRILNMVRRVAEDALEP